MKTRCRFTRTDKPALARTESPVELTRQAKAFRRIRDWVEHDGFDLEDTLFRILPVPGGISTTAGILFRSFAARSLTFLTMGEISLGWRRTICPVTKVTAVFYERGLDCCFFRFDPKVEDDPRIELRMHTVTLLDARDVLLEWSEENFEGERIDAAEFLLHTGVLTWSNMLPDNSRESWEQYAASMPLVPDFEEVLNFLAAS